MDCAFSSFIEEKYSNIMNVAINQKESDTIYLQLLSKGFIERYEIVLSDTITGMLKLTEKGLAYLKEIKAVRSKKAKCLKLEANNG